MTTQSYELFSLSTSTPANTVIHGDAATYAVAEAGAAIHRGVDLSAGFDFRANVNADYGDMLNASFKAGVGARAGLALQAMFPIDLFTSAGVVARFRAQAEASAFISAALKLELIEFYRLLRGQTPSGPMEALLEIFLEEVAIEAGLWARASFSAQVVGQAAFTGTLLASNFDEPGFTFTLQYALGWFYGMGYQFQTNIGIENPHRLFDRMSRTISSLALAEVDRYVQQLSPGDAASVQPAQTGLRILLPLAVHAAFQLGIDLAGTPSGQQKEMAARSLFRSILQEAQEQVFRLVFSFASNQVSALLNRPDAVASFGGLTEADFNRVVDDLVQMRDRVRQLDSIPIADFDDWLKALLGCLPPFEDLLTFKVLPADVVTGAQHAIALFWCAGSLLARLYAFSADQAQGITDLFGGTPVAVPNNSLTAAYIAGNLKKIAGSPLTLKDLVDFLLGADLETSLRTALPESGPVLDWLQDALSSPAGGLVQHLLVDLVNSDEDNMRQVLSDISGPFTKTVQDEVIPKLIEPLKAADAGNQPLATFLNQVVDPLLLALPVVILPLIAELDQPAMQVRFREAISAVLMQSLQGFAINSVDILLEYSLTNGAGLVRQAGEAIYQLGESHPIYGVLMMLASHSVFPIALTPKDAQSLLGLSADLLEMWNKNQRENELAILREVLLLGLATEDSRNLALKTITTSDDPASLDDLSQLLLQTTAGLWEMVGYALPRLLGMMLMHFVHEAELIAETIYEVSKAIVEATIAAFKWLGKQVQELVQYLQQIAQQIAQFVGRIAGDIRALSNYLITLVDTVVDGIRSIGLGILSPLLDSLPDWMKAAFVALYDALFDAVEWLLTAPLQILSAVAGWVEAAVTGNVDTSMLTEQNVFNTVRQKIRAQSIPSISFGLKLVVYGQTIFDLGTVTIPSGSIAGAIADAVLGEPVFIQTVRGSLQDAIIVRGLRAQQQLTQQAYQQTLDMNQAQAEAGRVAPQRPLQVTILQPASQSIHSGSAEVKIRVEGANETFIKTTLGIPSRMKLRLNGKIWEYAEESWMEDATGISFRGRIIPRTPPPEPPLIARRPLPISVHEIQTATNVTVSLSEDRSEVVFSGAHRQPVIGLIPTLPLPIPDVIEIPASLSGRASLQRLVSRLTPLGNQPQPPLPVMGVGRVAVQLSEFQMQGNSPVVVDLPSDPNEIPEISVGDIVSVDGVSFGYGQLGLNSLQVSVSDGKSETASSSALFFLQPMPVLDTGVVIGTVELPHSHQPLEAGYIEISNTSEVPVDLAGWTLRDAARRVFEFPSRQLDPGQSLRVWIGEGTPAENDLSWDRPGELLEAMDSETLVLADARGSEIVRRSFQTRSPIER